MMGEDHTRDHTGIAYLLVKNPGNSKDQYLIPDWEPQSEEK